MAAVAMTNLLQPPGVDSQMATWKNSTDGIHAFLTFDSGATVDAIQKYGSRIDYVWGHGGKATDTWRKVNPDVVLSKYIPYTRDPGCPQMSGEANASVQHLNTRRTTNDGTDPGCDRNRRPTMS